MRVVSQLFENMKLSDIKIGERAVIVKVAGHGGFRRRVVEMGFIKGKVVEVCHAAPFGDPIEYVVMGSHVSLRRAEADRIEVVSIAEAEEIAKSRREEGVVETISESELLQVALDRRREIQVALVGNPNAGKTSLFNILTGMHEKVGNYAGVTVDARTGDFDYKGYHIHLVDLPGTYSISAYSPEERYVREQIVNGRPDVIINVVDAGNLERNLFLTTQLIDMNVRMVIALNMYDELEAKGDVFDYEQLGAMIGVPMIPTVSTKMRGINELFDCVIGAYEGVDFVDAKGNSIDITDGLGKSEFLDSKVWQRIRHIHINYGPAVEGCIDRLKMVFKDVDGLVLSDYTPRYMAIKLLEMDGEMDDFVHSFDGGDAVLALRDKCSILIRKEMNDSAENIIQDAKYGFIAGALKETYRSAEKKPRKKTWTGILDDIVLSRLLGYPIFLFVVFLIFQATFVLGEYPMEWIESGVNWFADWLTREMTPGMLHDLLVDGVVQGVGGVLVFLPNILILYFFITMLEVSGYMARAAFIMDKIMHRIGLHGRSFIPLIMGFGCNVPAIMATRTIENRNARMITILISPLMSCSARLPIYLLLAGTFFPENAGVVLFLIYLTGVVLAGLLALLFRRLFFSKEEVPFVMELPPYRFPSVKVILRDTWERCEQYLRKIGTTILIGSVVIWALSYFPMQEKYDDEIGKSVMVGADNNDSYLGRMGRFIEPAIRPLGFDWKIGVSLMTGIAAKEVVVSTMGILYNSDGDDTEALSQRLVSEIDATSGEPFFNVAVALSLMLFVLIYFPCIGTIATIKNETGSWKWALFTIFYTVALAWIVSFVVYQSIMHNIWQEVLVAVIVAFAVAVFIVWLVNSIRGKHTRKSCGHGGCDGCPGCK